MENYKDIMVDLETIGNTSNSAIFSISAVRFCRETGFIEKEFHVDIDIQSCFDLGLMPTGSTLSWWLNQDKKAIEKLLTKNRVSIQVAIEMFNSFLTQDDILWGNSARFDLGILANIYTKLNKELKWEFYNEMCFRTLNNLIPEIRKNTPFEGIKHYGIDDCKHQVKVAVKILNKIKENE